ncbi:tyrosine-type recombinase/integrase [Flavobacterium sp. '19STA2R22 D10 B1']|uniref:tyrosine-type recombinase/integrase n=1 Tax=Flavobacterium aerium TaxID=3037261 RepID=UPI00278C4A46|nr:phage integrase SAM-like domain-containing protein [Flavobacterium sp. '19STA2R22 D10 B1']
MTIEIKLLSFRPEVKGGFPIVVMISHNSSRKKKTIGHSLIAQFNQGESNVSKKHPEYDFLYPKIIDLKYKAKRLLNENPQDVNYVYNELFRVKTGSLVFFDFGTRLIEEMKMMGKKYEKNNDLVNRNKIVGNALVYKGALNQFNDLYPGLSIVKLDYNSLMGFRNFKLTSGNERSTVALYLRTLRAIYNKAILIHKLEDTKPFKGVFMGLRIKSFESRKKYITKRNVQLIENYFHKSLITEKYTELWLLQFYFGGADLIDVYFLKRSQIRNGRILFKRSKTNTNLPIDLKITEKAQLIIDKYSFHDDKEYLFPWRKDTNGYKTFRRNLQEFIIKIQKILEIEVLPDGGNLGIKVARHTFANIAKNLNIEPDLIRELMGHERDAVDNYYKDRFPQIVRDKALMKIIE